MVFDPDLRRARRRTALRALRSDPLPRVPSACELLGSKVRRPGELHEPLALEKDTAQWLENEASSLGVTADVVGSVLLEAGLLADDLGPAAFQPVPPAGTAPTRPLSAAEGNYLRVLTLRRAAARSRPGAAAQTIAVPVRVALRLPGRPTAELLRAVDGSLALAWERSAVLEGRTLSEHVLLAAMRARV
jgi:hypothetical protein